MPVALSVLFETHVVEQTNVSSCALWHPPKRELLQVKIDDVAAEAMELLLHAMYACVGRPADSYSVELDEDSLPGGIPSQLALPLFLVADRYDVRVSIAASARRLCLLSASVQPPSQQVLKPCRCGADNRASGMRQLLL